MDHISIVIVHYNAEADTLKCLDSLRRLEAKRFRYQIIVLDNASKEIFTVPPKLQELPLEILRSETNLGFTGGNNLLVKHALETYQSDYVLLLNNDTIVSPNFLTELHAYLVNHPEVGMVNPLIYFTAGREFHQSSYQPKDLGKVLWFGGGSIDWRNLDAFHRGIDELDRGQFAADSDMDFATGCCVLLPRKVLEIVGGLDDRYFLYLEDVDWSMRVKYHGFALKLCPTAKIWHTNAGSTGGPGSPLHLYYQTRNRLWFCWRYGSWRTKLTVISLAVRLAWRGGYYERRAIVDVVVGNLGKQTIL